MKKFSILLLSLVAVAYSVIYASIGGFVGNKGALSKIGLYHPVLFVVWGVLTCLALYSNIIIAFSKTKFKFYIALLIIAGVGMALTLIFDFDYDKQLDYWLHCVGSMTFSCVMGLTVFLLFLLKRDYIFATLSAVIMMIDLVMLIIFKETAIIELAPIFAGLLMLVIHNMRGERVKIEA